MNLIKKSAETIISIEGNAILNLKKYINNNFEKTITEIAKTKGRIVITGIGKSAIVAQKIVSTLNSTGTPSMYMHAADAVHGDLGMIQKKDTVIIISKSGESAEIKVLVPLIKNFGNIIVGMVGNLNSYLATNSHFILNTTISEEACPNNLAPTTSTTAQMVMGDIIAVCLMKLNGFKPEHFAKYHPGGALGKQLYLTVHDLYINNEKPIIFEDESIKEVIIEISKKRLGAVVVVNKKNELVGIITDGDIRRALEKYDDLKNIKAKDILNKNAKTITENEMAVNALKKMKEFDIMQLVVVKGKKYLGIIHLHEILKEGII